MPHRLRIPSLMLLLALATPIGAQEAEEQAVPAPPPARPLNLSLPREAVWPSPVRPEMSGGERAQTDAAALPDFSAGPGRRDRQPYGTGYEARQRGGGSSNSSSSGGGSGGSGRGRGRGR